MKVCNGELQDFGMMLAAHHYLWKQLSMIYMKYAIIKEF
jgi:hypothetical protein